MNIFIGRSLKNGTTLGIKELEEVALSRQFWVPGLPATNWFEQNKDLCISKEYFIFMSSQLVRKPFYATPLLRIILLN